MLNATRQKQQQLRQGFRDHHGMYISHGGLNMGNIPIHISGNEPGEIKTPLIIDCAQAGCLPSHWELWKMRYVLVRRRWLVNIFPVVLGANAERWYEDSDADRALVTVNDNVVVLWHLHYT